MIWNTNWSQIKLSGQTYLHKIYGIKNRSNYHVKWIENIGGWYCMVLVWCSIQLFELIIGVHIGMHLARHCFFVKSLYLHLFLGNKSFGSFYIVNDMWQWQSTFYLWTFIIYFCCSWTHFFLCCYVLVRKVTSKRVTRMQCIPSIL